LLHWSTLGVERKRLIIKFPDAKINYYHIIKSFSYFDDAEKEPLPRMLIPLNWLELKSFFLEEQIRLLKKIEQFSV
jgi:hypothetical protein